MNAFVFPLAAAACFEYQRQ